MSRLAKRRIIPGISITYFYATRDGSFGFLLREQAKYNGVCGVKGLISRNFGCHF